MNKVNIAEKLALFTSHWEPKIIGALNGQHVKLVKFRGAFVPGFIRHGISGSNSPGKRG
jgi:hypothetical protein